MWRFWWNIPGPLAFIEELIASFRSGNNAIVALPSHSPPEIQFAVARHVLEDDLWQWTLIDLAYEKKDAKDPLALLSRKVLNKSMPRITTSADWLVSQPGFQDQIVWIEGVNSETWGDWKSFVREYARACQSSSQSGRGLVCISFSGLPGSEIPNQDVALSSHIWKDRVDELDMQIWVAYLQRQSTKRGLEKKIRRAIVTALAGTDPELAVELNKTEMRRLLDPCKLLTSFAASRNWTPEKVDKGEWESGIREWIDGEERLHSAALGMDKKKSVELISTRIWHGQLSVLFPLIEQKRRTYIDRYERFLYVPYTRNDGSSIKHLEDLEIGHIFNQLRRKGAIDLTTKEELRRLREVRNALAHLDIVGAADLEELVRSMSHGIR